MVESIDRGVVKAVLTIKKASGGGNSSVLPGLVELMSNFCIRAYILKHWLKKDD